MLRGSKKANIIIFNDIVLADSPTGMYRQLPTDLSAQHTLLPLLDRQVSSIAQQACEGAEQGSCLLGARSQAQKLSLHEHCASVCQLGLC